MIKKYFILSAVAAMATVACTKEVTPETGKVNENLIEMTFTAESEPSSKVAYNRVDNVGSLTWEADDKISVISKEGTFEPFTASSVDGNKATFAGWQKQSEEYYAVYPAEAVNAVDGSAFVTKGTKTGLLVDIPAVQKATAGTFDPKAFVAVSGPAVDGKFSFVNLCTVIGFQLKDPANVKAVRFEGLNTNNKGEAQAVTVASRGVVTPGDESGAHTYYDSPSTQITLTMPDGGFKAKTDYYFTTRPSKFDKGITVYIEYNDGSVKKRTSTKQLFTDNSRGVVKHLQAIDEGAVELTPYDAWELGYDLVIAGNTYNKSTFKANVIRVAEAGTLIEVDGMYFIEPTLTDVSISRAGGFTTLVIVGNSFSKRTQVAIGQAVSYGNNSVVAFKNIHFGNFANALFKVSSKTTTKSVSLDNCYISTTGNGQIFFNDVDRFVVDLKVHNCDFHIAADNHRIVTARANYTNVEFVNNIFFSQNAVKGFNVFCCPNANYSASVTNFTLKDNTFINTYANPNNGYVYPTSLTGHYVNENNLFELGNYKEVVNNTNRANLRCYLTGAANYPATSSVKAGYFYAGAGIDPEGDKAYCMKFSHEVIGGAVYPQNVSAFTTLDFENVRFVKTSARAKVGATR